MASIEQVDADEARCVHCGQRPSEHASGPSVKHCVGVLLFGLKAKDGTDEECPKCLAERQAEPSTKEPVQ